MENISAKIKFEEIIDGGYRFYSLNLLCQLKVNDILNNHGGYMSAEDVCKQIPDRKINAGYLQRIMRYLACFDVVDEKYENEKKEKIVFKSTDVFKHFPHIRMFYVTTLFPRLMDLLDGTSKDLCENVWGKSLWEYLSGNPLHDQLFKDSMVSYTKEIQQDVPIITDVIQMEWGTDASIIDIGGNTGQMMEMIYKEMPTLKCTNFDVPDVIQKNKLISNVEMLAGDMFKANSIPSKDIYFTKNIFHDWSDEECILIMKNIHEKINKGGLMISVNYYLHEPGEMKEAWRNKSMDISLLVLCGTSRERTLTEYCTLCKKAGLVLTKTVPIGPEKRPMLVVIAKKKELKCSQ